MMDAKRITKTDLRLKDIVFKENTIVDFETGEEVNLISALKEVYGEEPFTLSCTTKMEEIIELESNDFD